MRRLLAASLFLLPTLGAAQAPQVIPVSALPQAPKVDGKLTEWGSGGWIKVAIKPALDKPERAKFGLDPAEDKNQTGSLVVQMKAGVSGGRLYLALKYPDAAADTQHRPWEWRGDKYVDSKQREDMLALRFHMAGDFDRSMLTNKDYKVDVWQWSAARTNHAGVAEDMFHHITTRMLEEAAEYTLPDRTTVYMRKQRDAGNAPYKMIPRPKVKAETQVPSFVAAVPSGSAADVAAKGEWNAGHWEIEFSRALNTGQPEDDAVFKPGQTILGQLAVFNKGFSEHKSVSEPLLFDFAAIK